MSRYLIVWIVYADINSESHEYYNGSDICADCLLWHHVVI